jgi:hypothetical protein
MTNRIVVENQKTGNPPSEWDIVEIGDANIVGFATAISADPGETVSFKVDTDSADYRIDIYRLGYYGGDGARKVYTIQVQIPSAQVQPDPLIDLTTGLIDCGNWGVSASWVVPADAVTGLYIAKLVRQDTTAGVNHMPFIVRDNGVAGDVLFMTADTTWQAYNPWGGYNLYGGTLPPGRAYKVSYNRPYNTRGIELQSGPQDWIFGAEYPAIRWLEQNGYNLSYATGVDADRDAASLLAYKILLSVGHDEYWSAGQRANVEAARDAGVHLAFFSGNECYWKIRWEPSTDVSATPYRTMVCYKESRANAKIDPSLVWTGSWRDPRFSPPGDGGRPENGLTGTIFQVDSYRLDTITIPYAYSRLRFWRNTTIASLTPGQTGSLVTGYLGYEWDEDRDNGARPAGLIDLSLSTVNVNTYLRDYGTTVGTKDAVHSLTLYRAPSGALVFGAGTVYWAWGLDPNHDNEPTPADPIVQQVTVNLFADMGVQPATLQPGLVAATASTDTTPPTSTITVPAAGTTWTEGQQVVISGTAADTGGGIVAGVEVSLDGGTTWRKATGTTSWSYKWTAQAAGSYTLKSRATDDSVNMQVPGSGVTVTVGAATTVSVWGFGEQPVTTFIQDPNAVELGVKFVAAVDGTIVGLKFYKGLQNEAPHTGSLWASDGTLLASVTFTDEIITGWQTARFATPVAIVAGTVYVASYHTAGFYSADANGFATARTTGPLTALADSDGGNGVFAYGATSAFPATSFQASNYWIDVLFVPSMAPAGVGLFSLSDVPATVTVNDPSAVELGVKFTTDAAGTVTGVRFYKGPQNTGTHQGRLWTAAGTLLATATFSSETASGWQTAYFATAVAIVPGTTYIVSYHSNGFYSANGAYFGSAHVNGHLTAPADAGAGGNGVYSYGASGSFPNNSFNATNYWVDVVFVPGS